MNIAILTAGGVGSRTHQDIPKQFIHVNNKPVIIYTLEAFQKHPNVDEICVAILEGWDQILWAYAKQFNITKLKYVVTGGTTGQESIFNGLSAIRKDHSDDDVVIIHDGNRPMVEPEVITNNLGNRKNMVQQLRVYHVQRSFLCQRIRLILINQFQEKIFKEHRLHIHIILGICGKHI